jgi:hypothetical protein
MLQCGAEWLLNAAFTAFYDGGRATDTLVELRNARRESVAYGFDALYQDMQFQAAEKVWWFRPIQMSTTEAMANTISFSLRAKDNALHVASPAAELVDGAQQQQHVQDARHFAECFVVPLVVGVLELYDWYSRTVDDTLELRLRQTGGAVCSDDSTEIESNPRHWRLSRNDALADAYADTQRRHCMLHSDAVCEPLETPFSNRIHWSYCTLCFTRLGKLQQAHHATQ